MKKSSHPDPKLWPFEARITREDGSEYCQSARDNQDGTVTVLTFNPPEGWVERTLPIKNVELRERPSAKAQRWRDLFEEVYGSPT